MLLPYRLVTITCDNNSSTFPFHINRLKMLLHSLLQRHIEMPFQYLLSVHIFLQIPQRESPAPTELITTPFGIVASYIPSAVNNKAPSPAIDTITCSTPCSTNFLPYGKTSSTVEISTPNNSPSS